MATSKSHSWPWNSFISPRNSKWLSENLQETDRLVNEMLKLIEEDGDSFAKKAQMYYQRRPELISHVGDFYRKYRALAERYDHAISDLAKNIPTELQSQGSVNGSEFGAEVASISVPSSPDRTSEHKMNHLKPKWKASSFEVFLENGEGSDHSKKDSDESSSESSSDCDNGKVFDDYENPSKLEDRIIELEQELCAARVKLHKCKNRRKEQFEDLANNENSDSDAELKGVIAEEKSKHEQISVQKPNPEIRTMEKEELIKEAKVSYESKLKFLEERVEQLEAEKSKVRTESEKQISELNQSLYNFKMKVDMLTLEKDELSGEVIRLIEDIETWDEESRKIDEQLCELQIEHEKLIQEVEDARRASAELTNRVMELEEEVEMQRGVIIDCAEGKREAIRNLCFSLEHYRDEYRQLRQILEMKVKGL